MSLSPPFVARATVAGLLLFGTVGCQSANLSAAKVGQLQIGQTNEERMKAMFGDPDRSGVINEKGFTSCVYRYYEHDASPLPFTPPVLSSLMVEMRDNRLIGYSFLTTRKGEVTRFDETAAKSLKAGVDTQSSVTQSLGAPHGHVMTPSLIKEVREITVPGTKDVWVYTSGEALMPGYAKPGAVKLLFIAFDGNGQMQNSMMVSNKLNYFF